MDLPVSETTTDPAIYEGLTEEVRGTVLSAGDDGYDDARTRVQTDRLAVNADSLHP